MISIDILMLCSALTSASCQVPTKLLCHSPSINNVRGEKKYKKLMGQDKDKEIILQAKQTHLGQIIVNNEVGKQEIRTS